MNDREKFGLWLSMVGLICVADRPTTLYHQVLFVSIFILGTVLFLFPNDGGR